MNKKRKILTVAALAVFSVIIVLHYINLSGSDVVYLTSLNGGKAYLPGHAPEIEDVRPPALCTGRVLRRAVRYPGRQQTKRNNESFLIAG